MSPRNFFGNHVGGDSKRCFGQVRNSLERNWSPSNFFEHLTSELSSREWWVGSQNDHNGDGKGSLEGVELRGSGGGSTGDRS